MSAFLELRPTVKGYIALVVAGGTLAVGHSLYEIYSYPFSVQWFVLALLTVLTGSFSVKVSSINAYISVSETFVLASVLLFGTSAGTAIVLLECLVILLWMRPTKPQAHRVLFNMAAPTVAIWISGTAFYRFSGVPLYSQVATPLPHLFLPLLGLTTLYFLLNSWLVAVAVGLEHRQSPATLWWKNFAWLSINYFSGASVAALVVNYTRQLDLSTLAIIVPILSVSYLTFRAAMGRAEDSYKHLSELNRLYLSTIETLAMAIDAKDQITHGHIRRVQSYAVGLAKHVGITEERLIKAIEAAALLHDMGKLAVPEYILNKPGKLTPAEFDKMKLHASVGADILSAIDFPYPVVPIVRHHHENWDGTGYPHGLKGTDIPIGARILSVVDCFDALTSDRPYRSRLSDLEALTILLERRGLMYDPLIVDTFTRVYQDIAPQAPPPTATRTALNEITSSSSTNEFVRAAASFEGLSANSAEILSIYDVSRSLAGQVSISDAGDVITKHLRRLVPFSLSILYLYDDNHDALIARHAFGELSPLVCDLQIPLGARLSGWVGAHRQTIINSDSALDLGDIVKSSGERPRFCLSTPLVSHDALVGVLSLYSTSETFSDDHRRIIEAVARHIAHTFRRAAEFDTNLRNDPVTGLPTLAQLHNFLDGIESASLDSSPLTLMSIAIVNMNRFTVHDGRTSGDDALRYVSRRIQECLGITDLLFRCDSEQFVAVIGGDVRDTGDVASRIREVIRQRPLAIGNNTTLTVDVVVRSFQIPPETTSVRDFVVMQLHGSPLSSDEQLRHIH
jgi:diguanylate cyclase (GGDEF)-like protein/putative nucleotidyltransferase with HDIG domain